MTDSNMQMSEGYFDAPNLDEQGKHRIHYLDWGSSDAPHTVLCVHGLTRNAHDFSVLAEAIASKRVRVLAPSMAGRGQSEWLANPLFYNYATYAADCIALLDNFHLRSVDWVGTSMGGIIGMMIAAMHPKRIKRLVLNDVGSVIPASGLAPILQYVSETPKQFESREDAQAQLRRNMATFGIDDEAHWQQLFASSIQEVPAQEGASSYRFACDPMILEPVRIETQDFTQVQDVDLVQLWAMIAIPALILRGEHSALLSAQTVSSMCASNPKAQSKVIAGVGHAPALMKPSETMVVSQWLMTYGAALV